MTYIAIETHAVLTPQQVWDLLKFTNILCGYPMLTLVAYHGTKFANPTTLPTGTGYGVTITEIQP